MILNEDTASKTQKHTINEVRSIFKRSLNIDKDMHEVIDQPLSDDFLNLIEIACSIKPQAVISEDEKDSESGSEGEVIGEIPPMFIGITFLNKHCFVPDLYADSKDKENQMLIKRSVELKYEFLRNIFNWQLLIIDEADFQKLKTKEEKEKFILSRLQQPEEKQSDEQN